MGKTTNALEKVAAFYAGDIPGALELFRVIKENHLQVAETLGLLDNPRGSGKKWEIFLPK